MSEHGDFWTRRREAVEAEKRAADAARDDAGAEAERRALEERPDEEVLAELDLPDPDSLGKGDDFAAFMAKAVPERLRRRALRRLWLSNPVLANLDELLDYGEDFTDAATVIADLQSVYRVGKGMLRDEDLAEAAEADDEAPPEAEEQDEDQDAAPPEDEPGDGGEPAETAAGDPLPGDEEEIPAEPRAARRMRFAFADPDPGDRDR
ncbi:MAG: DUF3306 domain-containing protein [Defluviicoccus sp.]|nr:DUF3306 domain-containing protein [Defluviicoccus sp.]MDE0384508.1 DUF3306 domain-containing protein [Defluviicoccus sp.]